MVVTTLCLWDRHNVVHMEQKQRELNEGKHARDSRENRGGGGPSRRELEQITTCRPVMLRMVADRGKAKNRKRRGEGYSC